MNDPKILVTSAADCRRSVGPNTRRMPHLPGIPKTHFKTRVRMHALAELLPFPELLVSSAC